MHILLYMYKLKPDRYCSLLPDYIFVYELKPKTTNFPECFFFVVFFDLLQFQSDLSYAYSK